MSVFRGRRIHDIPELCIRSINLQRGLKNTRIIQARGQNTNDSFVWALRTGKTRSALWTKTSQIVSAGFTLSAIALNRALRDTKCREWKNDRRSVGTTGHSLAIATMALQHHNGRGGAFETHSTANTTTCNWSLHPIEPFMDYCRLTQSACDLIAQQLNNRPRKRHGYKTPNQRFLHT